MRCWAGHSFGRPPRVDAPGRGGLDAARGFAGTATFTASATGDVLSYLWHFNGLELADGPTGNGSTISGSSTPTLTISNAQLADEGQYLVRVFNPCGGATSLDAPLDVNTCPADFNNDGDLNPDDLADYINCYFSSPPCPQADFNADSDTNPDDLSDYINAYFAGCA